MNAAPAIPFENENFCKNSSKDKDLISKCRPIFHCEFKAIPTLIGQINWIQANCNIGSKIKIGEILGISRYHVNSILKDPMYIPQEIDKKNSKILRNSNLSAE